MSNLKDFFEYVFNAVKIWVVVQPWQGGIRVRFGKQIKNLKGGVYFRIPYFDSVFIKDTRLRVVSLPIQTLTSSDEKTVTLSSSVGYSITSVGQLYKTLNHPETTIANMAMSVISEFIYNNKLLEISPERIEEIVLKKLNAEDYGIRFEYFKITSFAVVRTYRLIQDQSWMYEGLDMENKK